MARAFSCFSSLPSPQWSKICENHIFSFTMVCLATTHPWICSGDCQTVFMGTGKPWYPPCFSQETEHFGQSIRVFTSSQIRRKILEDISDQFVQCPGISVREECCGDSLLFFNHPMFLRKKKSSKNVDSFLLNELIIILV